MSSSMANSCSLEPGQTVISHGVDRGLDPDEILQHTEV